MEQNQTQSAFRVGGVYRTNGGAVVELFNEGLAWGGTRDRVFNGLNLGGRRGSNNGQWLPDGRFYNGIGDQIAMSLIPGELHQVNGEWVPKESAEVHSPMIAAAPEEKLASVKVCEEDIWSDEFISSVIASRPRPFRFSGASVKFHSGLSYLGGTVAAEQTDKLSLDGLMADLLAKPVKREPLTVDIARYAIAHGGLSGKRADKPAEPQRPRLTWADTKPVDRFPGFISTTSVAWDELSKPEASHSHPLQKMAEGKEGFGSAALLKVR